MDRMWSLPSVYLLVGQKSQQPRGRTRIQEEPRCCVCTKSRPLSFLSKVEQELLQELRRGKAFQLERLAH